MSQQLPAYVKALLQPSIYPHKPASVELVQTQMSFVFIAGEYTYKTKKPVNLGFLDYTTLDLRKKFCLKEIELNRRLCPEVYLDVVPITQLPEGFKLGDCRNVIEYAVKMKTLARQRMMNVLLQLDQVTPDMLQMIALKLANFHAQANTGPDINSFGSLETIKTNTDENFSQTEKYIDTIIPNHVYHSIRNWTDRFMLENRGVFNQRVIAGKIRDCHGDLHTAHICFADDLYIYDCIEFNDRFRYCDTVSEIAFLAMDIDRYGRADLGRYFVKAYIEASNDQGLTQLLDFYKCYRAYVRGKVACFKYDDPLLPDKPALRDEARLYFSLAYKYITNKPFLIIVTGLIGTGKTTAAAKIGHALDCVVLSSDVIRKKLAGVPLHRRQYDNFNQGLYTPEITHQTYKALLDAAKEQLSAGKSVVLDASFKKRTDRLAAMNLAKDTGAGFLAVECLANEEVIKRRLEYRQQQGSVSDGRWEIFNDIKKDFEPVDELNEINHIVLDTANTSGNINALILERLTLL